MSDDNDKTEKPQTVVEHKLDPPYLPNPGRGRKQVDWENLFYIWRDGNEHLTKAEFLENYKLPITKKWVETQDWDTRTYVEGKKPTIPGGDPAKLTVLPTFHPAKFKNPTPEEKEKEFEEHMKKVTPIMEFEKIKPPKTLQENKDKGKPIDEEAIWKQIVIWRSMQTKEDYATADNLRQHIKLFLNNKILYKGKKIDGTALRASDIANISKALLDVQRIQRLALGLSTENMGVRGEAAPSQEVGRTIDDVPIFAVEINDNGKFVRPRPRQVEK